MGPTEQTSEQQHAEHDPVGDLTYALYEDIAHGEHDDDDDDDRAYWPKSPPE